MDENGKSIRNIGSEGKKLIGFLAAGLPAFFIAVPLNAALVGWIGLPKPLAYGIVLVLQVTLNFFMCRWFVFKPGKHKTLSRQFLEFSSGILGFRVADWLVYTVLVYFAPSYYLAIQIFNVLLFAALKYRFSRQIIEGV